MIRIFAGVFIAAAVTFAAWDFVTGLTRDELVWIVGIVAFFAVGVASMMRKPTEKDRR